MDIFKFAKKLNGRERLKEITAIEEREARNLGFVVLFGYSDDCAEFRGVYDDEVGCFDGGRVYTDGDLFVDALWCKGTADWTYNTNIPHATFDIFDEGELYCRGIVFKKNQSGAEDNSTETDNKDAKSGLSQEDIERVGRLMKLAIDGVAAEVLGEVKAMLESHAIDDNVVITKADAFRALDEIGKRWDANVAFGEKIMGKKKWKFVHNGLCWWLRVESAEQLMEYIKATSEERFGMSMLKVADRAASGDTKDWHNGHPVADAIDAMWRGSGDNLMETTGRLMVACHDTYFKLLREKGFVDINPVGGCNAFFPHPKAVEYRERLVFPHYTEQDIHIRTWELTDKRNYVDRKGYQYHYYAYLGDVQLKDGDKEKWDTREEALAFARTFLEREETHG